MDDVRKLYAHLDDHHVMFRTMRRSDESLAIWGSFVLALVIVAVIVGAGPLWARLVCIAVGVVALQLAFVAEHMESHALFLEYDEFRVGGQASRRKPITTFAYYHHHHLDPAFNSSNWAPQLSFHTDDGTRAVTAAHWHGFTLLKPRWETFFALLICIGFHHTIPFYAGYELGVLLLPIAHAWQHKPKSWFRPWLRHILSALEFVRLIANAQDHSKHHDHAIPYHYSDFSSSGLFLPCFDRWLNTQWISAWDLAIAKNTTPHKIIWPFEFAIRSCLLVLIPYLVAVVVSVSFS